ncbi:tail fiber protein [Hymenobacter sp. BT175]|uniref:phage tail protein n=1 Tax=Hymenobacter translucens TaxID=2886507 RepID=UPI001D0F4665|nr:tail fiber protein [Hymenobacter translucens]MCC2546268.1 tail fiber protein [Hymenobacter translucens]
MEPFIGEIRPFAFGYAPNDWMQCQGQLLSIRQYTALFSILGVQYGGDGVNTFALPNLATRVAVGMGAAPGLTPYVVGQTLGVASVTLTPEQMPAHVHAVTGPLQTTNAEGGTADPTNAYLANATTEEYGDAKTGTMGAGIVKGGPTNSTGNKQAHNNQMPSLAINYCIALVGTFPPRS